MVEIKILTLTTLFPNQQQPIHAVFVRNRIAALSDLCEVKVVAPVPWALPFRFFSRKHRLFDKVPPKETQSFIEVFHPRYLVTPKLGRNLYGFMYFLSIARFMLRLRRDYDFDLLDVHWAYPDGFAGVLLGKLLAKPVTITVRGSDINYFSRFFLRRKMIDYALKKADKVIAVCEDMGDKVSRLGIEWSKIQVIPNGVDIGKFYPLQRGRAREKLGLPKGRKIILSVGRLGYPKRFDHLIEAVNILVKKRKATEEQAAKGKGRGVREAPNSIPQALCSNPYALCSVPPLLIIVGDGEYRERLRNQIEALGLDEHVWLVGSKPNEELVYWYNAADIFCLASSSEGWPNVIFESLACGTPVVASAVGGVPEVVGSEEYGLLVYKQDVNELSKALEDALCGNWARDKLVKHAQANTWSKVAEEVYNVFQTVRWEDGYGKRK